MKKIVLLLAVLLFGAGSMMAQQDKSAEKAAKQAEKEAKKAEKAAKKAAEVYVTPNTNFVSVKGEKATIQLAFNTPAAGPNGIGGITVDGTTSGVQMKTDKKGNVMYEMNVQGVAVSARVTFRMAKGTNKCTATVSPNFNSNRISFTGNLYPSSESNVFKGRSI